MMKTLLQIALILILPTISFGQYVKSKPILFDEFQRITQENIRTILDLLLVKVQETQDSKALIRIYGNDIEMGRNSYFRQELYEAHIFNSRGHLFDSKYFPKNRIIIEQCNSNEEKIYTRLFVLPKGSNLEKCDSNLETPKKSTKFDEIKFYSDINRLITVRSGVLEPGYPDNEYSKNTLLIIKKFLEESPKNKIYVFAYLGTNFNKFRSEIHKKEIRKLDKKSTAKKMLKIAKNEIKKYGIKSSQIKTIYGGYVDDVRKLEFWFVPENGDIPKPKPTYFPKKQKAN